MSIISFSTSYNVLKIQNRIRIKSVYSTHGSLAIGRTVRNSSIYESRAKINPLEKQSHSTAGSAVAVRNYTNGVMGTADPSEIINDRRKHRSISSKRVSHGRNCAHIQRVKRLNHPSQRRFALSFWQRADPQELIYLSQITNFLGTLRFPAAACSYGAARTIG